MFNNKIYMLFTKLINLSYQSPQQNFEYAQNSNKENLYRVMSTTAISFLFFFLNRCFLSLQEKVIYVHVYLTSIAAFAA